MDSVQLIHAGITDTVMPGIHNYIITDRAKCFPPGQILSASDKNNHLGVIIQFFYLPHHQHCIWSDGTAENCFGTRILRGQDHGAGVCRDAALAGGDPRIR